MKYKKMTNKDIQKNLVKDMKQDESLKEYAKDNKEKYKEYRHKYYLNELDELKKKITCECCSTFQTRKKYCNLTTIKH